MDYEHDFAKFTSGDHRLIDLQQKLFAPELEIVPVILVSGI